MKRTVGKWSSGILESARRGLVRTPVEVAIGFATAMVFSYALAVGDHAANQFALTFGLAACTTLIAVFATSSLFELEVIDAGPRWWLTAGYLLAGLLYGSFVLDLEQIAELWRWGLLTSGLGLATLLVPLAARSQALDPRELTWRYTLRLGIRTLLTGLYTTLLFLGLSLGMRAFQEMFQVPIDGVWYGHLAAWIFVAGSTWMIAAGLPEFTDRESPISDRIAGLVHRVGVWLVSPLLGLYMLILYGYGARVLVTGEAPSNLLSPLSLGAAILGLVAMFFVEPLRRHGDDRWLADIFEKFPLAYLPLLPMPAWAIWERIAQYGWTEFRYIRLLAVAGLILCFGYAAWRTLRNQSFSVTGMPTTFALLFFLASFGPWGALGVAKSSQLSHLRADLADPSLDAESTTKPGYRGSPESHPAERLHYLVDHFGVRSLDPVLPAEADDVTTVYNACEVLDIDCHNSLSDQHASFRAEGPLSIAAPGELYEISYYDGSGADAGGPITLTTGGQSISFDLASGERYTADLAARFGATLAPADEPYLGRPLTDEEARIEMTAADGSSTFLYLERLSLERLGPSGDWTIASLNGHFLLPDH